MIYKTSFELMSSGLLNKSPPPTKIRLGMCASRNCCCDRGTFCNMSIAFFKIDFLENVFILITSFTLYKIILHNIIMGYVLAKEQCTIS